ncbi:monovalent cation/H+ antiporter subunit D [Pelagibacterium luteolum]|uniref:Multicomponent K+:H+ antiporter subunit D n=1 Tax=Pelagibacterium luteolum TaxID=440168 RepID=A0A1G7TDK5_9HYPH|nr:monovalent cation/H+ antiporter subunit D [Pelagibacterium luteolum]SDG32670.1 multicomponent K+:H+ antiporter subunit D [Pelagibacterium luteolum]
MTPLDHAVILPILLPLAVGAFLLLFKDQHKIAKAIAVATTMVALLGIAIALLVLTSGLGDDTWVGVYHLGNWSPIFGIVLVADRAAAIMVTLTAVLGLTAMSFASARWNGAGPHFHTLFLFLVAGVNGAFLTGDLFNLFVFFEIMLAASYGLLLHASTVAKVRSGLHYIAINLVASSVFLVGVSLIYGVTGTLNMAELAMRVPEVSDADRMLLEIGAAVLGIAFLVKAGMWPLCFWLPSTYTAAVSPVAAIFAILSKVGIYIIWRLSLLVFGLDTGPSGGLAQNWLLIGGLATLIFGSVGVLASQGLARLTSYAVIVSSGTMLTAIGIGGVEVAAGAFYYMVGSTLALAALFMLVELIERGRMAGADVLAVTMEAFGFEDEDVLPDEEEVGIPIPGKLAILGISFIACALLIAGMPPFSGFIAKFAILAGIIGVDAGTPGTQFAGADWAAVTLLIASGLAVLIAMLRGGINTFWATREDMAPAIGIVEIVPITVLIGACLALTIFAGPSMTYFEAAAAELHNPVAYVDGVMTSQPVPYPGRGELP